MRITSADRRSWIDVLRNTREVHSSFAVSCAVDIGHGRFSGSNADVHFLNASEFLTSLDRFILDRSNAVTLLGTYGTSLKLWQPDQRNLVVMSFAIGDSYAGSSVLSDFKTEGNFEMDQANLNSLLEDFRAAVAV